MACTRSQASSAPPRGPGPVSVLLWPPKKDIPGLVPVAQPDKINMVNIFTNKIRQQEDETGLSQGHPPSSLHGVISPRDAKSNSHEELPQLRDYPAAKYDLYI